MARMILIRLVGQITSDEDRRVHIGVGMGTIWGNCGAKVGVFVCHAVVGLLSIKADGCPEAGDFVCHSVVGFVCHTVVGLLSIKADGCPDVGDFVCHSVVGLLVIGADDGCPEVGDFRFHSVVGFGFVGMFLDPCSYASHSIAVHWVVGGVVALVGSSGMCRLLVAVSGTVLVCVQIIPPNSKVGSFRCCRNSGGDFLGPSRSRGTEGRPEWLGSSGGGVLWGSYSPKISFACSSPFDRFFFGCVSACGG